MKCSVRELLERFDSLEISEWRAFERAMGPIGTEYTNATLASMHEQLQTISYLVGAQYGEDSPVDQPKHYPRPNEMFPSSLRDSDGEGDHQADAADEAVGDADALNAYFDSIEQ